MAKASLAQHLSHSGLLPSASPSHPFYQPATVYRLTSKRARTPPTSAPLNTLVPSESPLCPPTSITTAP